MKKCHCGGTLFQALLTKGEQVCMKCYERTPTLKDGGDYPNHDYRNVFILEEIEFRITIRPQ